ncbi:MAG: hypothetical protein WD638_13175 [Nitriliruptoraceae bacterium]
MDNSAPPLRSSTEHDSAPAEQPLLPLDDDEPIPFVLAAAEEEPVGFALTARARRAVAPDSLPDLTLVQRDGAAPAPTPDPDGGVDRPGDTRPARARALRRAGVPTGEIAEQLDADPLTVAAWVGEVAPTGRRRSSARLQAVAPTPAVSDETEEELAHHLARADAASRARGRLREDAPFAVGVGLLAAIATVDRHAVTLRSADLRVVGRVLRWLGTEAPGITDQARVIARVGPQLAGDLARHRVADHLGLALEQVSWTRWRGASDPSGLEVLVRLADPSGVTMVAGWIDAALEPSDTSLDLAF